MECNSMEEEVKNGERRAAAKDGGGDGRGSVVDCARDIIARLLIFLLILVYRWLCKHVHQQLQKHPKSPSYPLLSGDAAATRRTILLTWLATRWWVWQALPSPSKSDGDAESVLVTWLRTAPRTFTEQVGEESSSPATHLRWMAVNVGAANHLVRLRLLHRLLHSPLLLLLLLLHLFLLFLPSLLLPCPLLRTLGARNVGRAAFNAYMVV
ncbi:unnamed protein product [Taenia asiatica]|uniref:Uncharacterized protein n=1 Tax=Taenia asiatica TaxID=60517 RepID=A0A0R3VXY8_TAEAS|nr:unnamed protein product [Taenia asiatica]